MKKIVPALAIFLTSCVAHQHSVPLNVAPEVSEQGDVDAAVNISIAGDHLEYGARLAVQPFKKLYFQGSYQQGDFWDFDGRIIDSYDPEDRQRFFKTYGLSVGRCYEYDNFKMGLSGVFGYGRSGFGYTKHHEFYSSPKFATRLSDMWRQGVQVAFYFNRNRNFELIPALQLQCVEFTRNRLEGNPLFYYKVDRPDFGVVATPSLTIIDHIGFINSGIQIGGSIGLGWPQVRPFYIHYFLGFNLNRLWK